MRNVLGIASGKGGVGKSSLAVFLAREFCRQGKTVLLFEPSSGARCLDVILGIEQRVVFDLGDFLAGRCGLDEGVLSVRHTPGLYLLPSPGSWDARINMESCKRAIELCANCYDWVIVDMPTGFNDVTMQCCTVCSDVINLVLPDVMAIRTGAQLTRMLQKMGHKGAKTVINMVREELAPTISDLDEIVDSLGLGLLGVIPYSEQWARAVDNFEELPNCTAQKAVENISARLSGQQRPLVVF